MRFVVVHDKGELERFLRHDPHLHLYEIGDLDDPYWSHTTWYALRGDEGIQSLALFYTGTSLPVLLAFSGERIDALCELLRGIRYELPERFYAHLSPGVVSALSESHRVESHGTFLKMVLARPESLGSVDTSCVQLLSESDGGDLEGLYDASYPGHWFEPGMLTAGHYYGIRQGNDLVSVAGVHVFSRRYRVAALGNIATHPRSRGKGLARAVTGKLCQVLHGEVDHIGLNVKDDNQSAIACYQRLGFETCATYGEHTIEVS